MLGIFKHDGYVYSNVKNLLNKGIIICIFPKTLPGGNKNYIKKNMACSCVNQDNVQSTIFLKNKTSSVITIQHTCSPSLEPYKDALNMCPQTYLNFNVAIFCNQSK